MSDKKEKEEGMPSRGISWDVKVDALRRSHFKESEDTLKATAVEMVLNTPELVEARFRSLLGKSIAPDHVFCESDAAWFKSIAKKVCEKMAQLEIEQISERADVDLFRKAIAALGNEIPQGSRDGQYLVYSFEYNEETAYEVISNAQILLGAFNHLCAAGGCARPFMNFPGGDLMQVKVRGVKPEYRLDTL